MATAIVKNNSTSSQRNYYYRSDISASDTFRTASTKVREPITAMLENNSVLARILANIWSNQPDCHSHFLGGALFLTTCGFDMSQLEDCVRMRYDSGLPVKLTWSAKRWKLEHDLGARRATARQLTAENVIYDQALAKFLPLLSRDCHDFVITNSRELGEHGVEMRHCIASYHASIKDARGIVLRIPSGNSTLTAWVQTCHDVTTAKDIGFLSMIKGELNAFVTAEEREQVAKRLGVRATSPISTYLPQKSKSPIPQYLRDRDFYNRLEIAIRQDPEYHDIKLLSVEWAFYGGGDSGSLENIVLKLSGNMSDLPISHQSDGCDYIEADSLGNIVMEGNNPQYMRKVFKPSFSLWDDSQDLCDLADWDWWNNDGGAVEISVDTDTLNMEIGGYFNFTESESQSCSDIDLTEEDE